MASNEAIPTWEQVATDYGRVIYNFAYRLTGNRDDASDLAQEVLVRVRRGLATYRPGSFEGWLWRITRNAFLDEVRRKQRRPTTELPAEDRSALVTSPTPDDVLAETRLSDEMQAALLNLPYEFREAVVMCDVVGLTYQEIADAAEVPVGTVRSRIHRGRLMLRDALEAG
ncbi:MAG: sigma-70 family RNA polymerase sigma factor [Acidimicrobiia bacterium]|nr:sigma-70 family RNA polymerase sigma factor [Acidimicrobiia bacterium]